MKKLKTVVFALLTGVAVCGCGVSREEIAQPWEKQGIDKETFFIRYMEERYGEKFTFLIDEPDRKKADFDFVLLKAERYPDKRVFAKINKRTGEMFDSYMRLYMVDAVEKELTDIVREIYPNSKLFYDIIGMPAVSQNPGMTLQEYLQFDSKMLGIPFVIFVEDLKYREKKDYDIEKLRESLAIRGYAGDMVLYYLQPGKLDLVERETWSSEFNGVSASNWHVDRGSFHMNESFHFDYKEWRETK